MGGKQKGFSIVEGLLVFVIVGILGFTGWFVWNSQKQTNKSNNSTVVSTKKATATNTTTTSLTATEDTTEYVTQGTAKYVVIKEWGVKFPLANTVKALSFTYDTSGEIFSSDAIIITGITDSSGKQFTSFTSSSTANKYDESVDAICITYGLGRSTNSSEINATTGSAFNQIAHIGNHYYYSARASGALCGQSEAATKATDATQSMFNNLTAE